MPTYDTVEKKCVFLGIRLWITLNTEAASSTETLLSIHQFTIHGVMSHTWNLHEHGCDNLKFRIISRECAERQRPCSVPTQCSSLNGPIHRVEKDNKTLSLKFRVPKMCWSDSLHFRGILATALQSGITEILRNRYVRICRRLTGPSAHRLHYTLSRSEQ
jgi:hypothetical protein